MKHFEETHSRAQIIQMSEMIDKKESENKESKENTDMTTMTDQQKQEYNNSALSISSELDKHFLENGAHKWIRDDLSYSEHSLEDQASIYSNSFVSAATAYSMEGDGTRDMEIENLTFKEKLIKKIKSKCKYKRWVMHPESKKVKYFDTFILFLVLYQTIVEPLEVRA